MLFTAALISLVSLTQVVPGVESVDCENRGVTNGCSVAAFLPHNFGELFMPSCHKHDQCYACGAEASPPLTRLQCDNLFKENLKEVCNRLSFMRRLQCYVFKGGAYLAARLLGKSGYKEAGSTAPWCTEPWVELCLGSPLSPFYPDRN